MNSNDLKFELDRGRIFTLIGESSSDEAIIIFYENLEMMKNYDLYLVHDGAGDSLSVVKEFFKMKKGSFESPFYKDNIMLVNKDTLPRLMLGMHEQISFHYDINLDTNIVSYIDNFVRGKHLSKENEEVVLNITRKRPFSSTMSLGPYIMENTLEHNELSEIHVSTIKNFYTILNENHIRSKRRSSKATSRRMKEIISFYNKDDIEFGFHEILTRIYKQSYVMLLKSIIIQNTKRGLNNKLIELLSFSNNEINMMMIAEINIAIEYFKKGNNFTFFSKIHKGNKKILKDIKNMNWDIFHVRHLEFLMGNFNLSKAKVVLPVLASMDKKFNELRSLIKLKALITDRNSYNYYPIHNNSEIKSILSKNQFNDIFSIDNAKKRRSMIISQDIDDLINKLEESIVKLFS